MDAGKLSDVEPEPARRLFVYNGGFLTQPRLKRILALSGYDVKLGAPGPKDMVGVWGMSPTAYRGETVALNRETPLLRVEDAWLRSLFPGRSGEPPIGLTLDQTGVHYDGSKPSDLETLLATHPLDDTALLNRARGAIERLKETHLTKYAAVRSDISPPSPGYVLVVDQTQKDASVTACGADRNRFLEMLFIAREEHPGAQIVVKSHPETINGHRSGYFTKDDLSNGMMFLDDPVCPWALLDGAIAVYTVSSQLGFEAIFAGHKPRVFGAPFYAGWGLTADEFPITRRQRTLTRAQLFAAAAILYPVWYDPVGDKLCTLEVALENLAATARAWRDDHKGWVASEMRLWKRPHLQKFFGQFEPVVFDNNAEAAKTGDKQWMVWASKATAVHSEAWHIEDGFLRSKGLGADLLPPLSLVLDDLGIYYDASKPNRLEHLIAEREDLRPDQQERARMLIKRINETGTTKYNLDGSRPQLPEAERILVVGQVEDDASITWGSDGVSTNRDLLSQARQAHPDAYLIYKPHPDVEAGLRQGGAVQTSDADLIASNANTDYLLRNVDRIWTITSLTGFEALLRGVPVTTLGAPFYAGWQLTTDLGQVPPRRRATPSLEGLVHAALIDYPRYFHPATQAPCTVETVVDWLADPSTAHSRKPPLRSLSKLQGFFASYAHLWRR